MKSWVTKLASELLDTILIVIGSVVVIASYIFASDGLFGIPAMGRSTRSYSCTYCFAFSILPFLKAKT